MKIVDMVRCYLGRPRTHREKRNGVEYAVCNHCNRQAEVHMLGGPRSP